MSEHMKARHTEPTSYISVTVGLPGKEKINYRIPNTQSIKNELTDLLEIWSGSQKDLVTPWEDAILWEQLAEERIKHYKKAGLVLRGARYREGLSQKELAQKCGISQDNLSRMENGKRAIGEKVAKRIAAALNIDYQLLIDL